MKRIGDVGARVSLRYNDAESYFFGHIKAWGDADVLVEMEESRAVYFGPQKVLEMRVFGGDTITIVQVVTLSENAGLIQLRTSSNMRVERDSSITRLRCQIPVEYQVLTGGSPSTPIMGMALDLSAGGIGIQSVNPPEVGNRLKMTLQLGREGITLEGTVRNTVEDGAGRFGVQFDGVSRIDQAKLLQFLREAAGRAA